MAITLVPELLVQPQSIGEVYVAGRDIAGPASYTGGAGNGQVISASMFGLLFVRLVTSAPDIDSSETYFVRVVPAGKGAQSTFRVRWYVLSSGAEVTNATNLSASKVRYLVVGD
jgi:hypothetical protein